MWLRLWLALTVKLFTFASGHRPLTENSVSCRDTIPKLHVFAASVVQSQTVWQRFLSGNSSNRFGPAAPFKLLLTTNSSACSYLRLLLLIAGDIESNPGPTSLDDIPEQVLCRVLAFLKQNDDDFVFPIAREGLVNELQQYNQWRIDEVVALAETMLDSGETPPRRTRKRKFPNIQRLLAEEDYQVNE